MVRTREAAGGGRSVEVEPERLAGWFERFAVRHGGIAETVVSPGEVVVQAADGARASVVVPFGGLPAAATGELPCAGTGGPGTGGSGSGGPATGGTATDGPGIGGTALDALHAHLEVPRRIGLVLVRLGGYSVGVADGGVVVVSSTGARQVHGRNRKGGSSSGRFARRREGQARVALDAAADTVARVLLPVATSLDAVVLGGDAAALEDLRADRRLAALLARAEPRVLDVPEPRRAVLDEAARRALTVEITVR